MPIDTRHPQHHTLAPRWRTVRDALEGEDAVKKAGDEYLPRTGGMEAGDRAGRQYAKYLLRARFFDVTARALQGIVGLVFKDDPVGASDVPITRSGKTNLQLSREIVRHVATRGRDLLLVDAPTKEQGGGEPFITRYAAESVINWKCNPANPATFSLLVLAEEDEDAADLYGHETVTRYRRYRLVSGKVELTRWERVDELDVLLEGPTWLPLTEIPAVAIGSIDTEPGCDPVPLLPVARCAMAAYRKSADFEHALHVVAQPTPYVTGITEEEYDVLLAQGIGSSALWHLAENGRAAFLETSGNGLAALAASIEAEKEMADSYAVQLTQGQNVAESGRARALRSTMQHASIFSIADSVSIGLNRAEEMRRAWSGERRISSDFALRTDFDEAEASEQMIQALNSAVNAGNAPQSVFFEALRRTGYTDKTDEEMLDEIEQEDRRRMPPPPPPPPQGAGPSGTGQEEPVGGAGAANEPEGGAGQGESGEAA